MHFSSVVPVVLLFLPVALSGAASRKWVTSWTASVQGPYPIGNASAQPDLRFAFPSATAGARDQTLRLIVQPDIWVRKRGCVFRMHSARRRSPLTACSPGYIGAQAPSFPAPIDRCILAVKRALRWPLATRCGAMQSTLQLRSNSPAGSWPSAFTWWVRAVP